MGNGNIGGDSPPFTHDLQRLCEELQLEIDVVDFDFLSIVNSWNIRGRYPDYTKRLQQQTTPAYYVSPNSTGGKNKKMARRKDIEREVNGYLAALEKIGFSFEKL